MANNDINEYEIIDSILNGNNNATKQILSNILKEYQISTNDLIDKTISYLNELTDKSWKKVELSDEEIKVKAIKCIDDDSLFYVAYQNKEVPVNAGGVGFKLFDQISYDDILKIDNFDLNKDNSIVYDALVHSYKELYTKKIDYVLEKYYLTLVTYKDTVKSYIEYKHKDLMSNNIHIDLIKEQVEMYKKAIRRLCSYDPVKFEQYNSSFCTDDTYKHYMRLANMNDVIYEINNFNSSISEHRDHLLNDKTFNFTKNSDGKYGWDWDVSFRLLNSKKDIYGYITKFVEAPQELLFLINQVNKFLSNVNFIYDRDPNYPIIRHNRNNYDSSLGNGPFETFPTGNLEIYVDKEKISTNVLLDHIKYLEKTVNNILGTDLRTELKKNNAIEEMKKVLIVNNKLSDKNSDLVSNEEFHNPRNWIWYSKNYSLSAVEGYCVLILDLINSIKKIISLSEEALKKAKKSRRYVIFYDKLFTIHSAYKRYNELINKCNHEIDTIVAENNNINSIIDSSNENCHEIDRITALLDSNQKRVIY